MFGPYSPATGIVTNRGVRYTYADKNLLTEKTYDTDTGSSLTLHKQYDDRNHVTAIGTSFNSDAPIWQAHISYDPEWQLPVAVTNAEGHWSETSYTNGRPLAVKAFWSDTQSHDTVYTYFSNGLPATITNPNDHATTLEYDTRGNLSCVIPPDGPSVVMTVNALGYMERSEIFPENGNSTGRITRYDVRAKGWVNSITHPDGLAEVFKYDNAGSVTNTTDRAGRKSDLTYAPTKKLTSITRYLNEGGSNTPVRIVYDFDNMFNGLSITRATRALCRNHTSSTFKIGLSPSPTSKTKP